MFFRDLAFAFAIAAIIVALFSFGLRRPSPFGGVIWFFLVVFLGAWAVGAWVGPIGPAWEGVGWAPMLAGAVLIALLISAMPAPGTPRPARRAPGEPGEPGEPSPPGEPGGPVEPEAAGEPEEEAAAPGAASAFFWILLILLLIAVIWAYAI